MATTPSADTDPRGVPSTDTSPDSVTEPPIANTTTAAVNGPSGATDSAPASHSPSPGDPRHRHHGPPDGRDRGKDHIRPSRPRPGGAALPANLHQVPRISTELSHSLVILRTHGCFLLSGDVSPPSTGAPRLPRGGLRAVFTPPDFRIRDRC